MPKLTPAVESPPQRNEPQMQSWKPISSPLPQQAGLCGCQSITPMPADMDKVSGAATISPAL